MVSAGLTPPVRSCQQAVSVSDTNVTCTLVRSSGLRLNSTLPLVLVDGLGYARVNDGGELSVGT